MNSIVNFTNVILVIIYGLYTPVLTSEVLRPRGISLAQSSFYDPSKPFTCFDGSGTFSFKHVNDDYCDCKDGSDEPGTAACLDGIFHCNNMGHVGRDISSSFVNDGVCDCCDTSDEYLSNADCIDECHVLGEAARVEARHRAEVQSEGFNRRQKMAEEGLKLKKEKQIRITELTKEKEIAELEQADKLSAKESAEDKEKAALEQYKALEEELRSKKELEQKTKSENEAREAFVHLDVNNDGVITLEEIQSSNIFDTNKDGTVSEEEAQFYMQQKDSMDLETFLTSGWNLIRHPYLHQKSIFTPPHTETPEDYTPPEESVPDSQPQEEDTQDKEYDGDLGTGDEELEEESDDYTDELETEIVKEKEQGETEEEEEEEKIQYDPETQNLIDLAGAAREEFRKADERLRELTREINSLQEVLEKDFGPNEEFRIFEEQCYQYTDREYVYELCPFNKATQRPKEGHGDTRLGSWSHWAGPDHEPYSVMKYTGGQACWNGPQRSAEVRLSCGTENELTSVSEPSRCEYLFLFTTPAVCYRPEDSASQVHHQHSEL